MLAKRPQRASDAQTLVLSLALVSLRDEQVWLIDKDKRLQGFTQSVYHGRDG